MLISSVRAVLIGAAVLAFGAADAQEVVPATPAPVTAIDAALAMANMLDGAGGGVSSADLMSALEDAAEAGQPMAMWQLGIMYENGEGVPKDPARAFGYFSQIANEHADTPPKGLEADIVAQSFVKVGEYYDEGVPDAGIPADSQRSRAMITHAATYFGDADAQYRLGRLYLDDGDGGGNPLQGARWLSLAARKGHAAAQATLGDLLFNGEEGLRREPEEGLMWLSVASARVAGTIDEGWINDLLNAAMSVATPEQRAQALKMADSLGTRFGGL